MTGSCTATQLVDDARTRVTRFDFEPGQDTGWICDLAEVEVVLEPIRKTLDHAYLNAVEGLDQPTLEAEVTAGTLSPTAAAARATPTQR